MFQVLDLMAFHPYEPFLVGANKTSGNLMTMDTTNAMQARIWHSGVPPDKRLTSLE
jgi:hypothetical protein